MAKDTSNVFLIFIPFRVSEVKNEINSKKCIAVNGEIATTHF